MSKLKRVQDSLHPTEQYGYHEHKAASRQRGTEASARVRHAAAERRRQERERQAKGEPVGSPPTGSAAEKPRTPRDVTPQ